jgi:hypothetical protein
MRLLWEEKNGGKKYNIEEKKEKIQENKKVHYRRKGKNVKKRTCYRTEKKPKKKRLVAREKKINERIGNITTITKRSIVATPKNY